MSKDCVKGCLPDHVWLVVDEANQEVWCEGQGWKPMVQGSEMEFSVYKTQRRATNVALTLAMTSPGRQLAACLIEVQEVFAEPSSP